MSFLLTPLPPCPSKTAKRVDLGQLERKQSITNDAYFYTKVLSSMAGLDVGFAY